MCGTLGFWWMLPQVGITSCFFCEQWELLHHRQPTTATRPTQKSTHPVDRGLKKYAVGTDQTDRTRRTDGWRRQICGFSFLPQFIENQNLFGSSVEIVLRSTSRLVSSSKRACCESFTGTTTTQELHHSWRSSAKQPFRIKEQHSGAL